MSYFDTKDPNQLAQLCLVACDMSYKGGAAVIGEDLKDWHDPVVLGPGYDIAGNGFKVLRKFDDPSTGYKAIIFENLTSKELVVAFGGTDGPNPKDWWANLFHMGMGVKGARLEFFAAVKEYLRIFGRGIFEPGPFRP